MIAVEAVNLGKQYRRYDAERPWTLHEFLTVVSSATGTWNERGACGRVSFEIEEGHALGVVGRNGAGKSTLLRLLSKVLIPDEGTVNVRGRLGGLLELTAGFHPDLTGRENAMIGGVLRGLTRSEVRQTSTRLSRLPNSRTQSTGLCALTAAACRCVWLSPLPFIPARMYCS